MGSYRGIRREIRRRCVDLDLDANPAGLATFTGLNYSTAWRLLNGYPVSIRTMGIVAQAFGCGLDDLFEPISNDDPAPSTLRSVRDIRPGDFGK